MAQRLVIKRQDEIFQVGYAVCLKRLNPCLNRLTIKVLYRDHFFKEKDYSENICY